MRTKQMRTKQIVNRQAPVCAAPMGYYELALIWEFPTTNKEGGEK